MYVYMRFKILTVVGIQITVLWDVMPCSLVVTKVSKKPTAPPSR
jgi:hypothetical protein